jgi:hypothetical protein
MPLRCATAIIHPDSRDLDGRISGSLAAFKFAIWARFKKLRSDSFWKDFATHPILLFQKMRGWLSRLGWSQDYYLYTYAPVLGGVSASAGLFTYFFLVSVERKKSRKNLLVLLGFLPYFYSLYIMGVLGLYTIYEGIIGKFSFWSMIGGLFWVFLGFHLIYRFYLMTEIVRQHDEKAMLAHSTLRQSDMN